MTNAKRLLAAVLVRACKDALTDDPALASEARLWLSTVGVELVEVLDLPGEMVDGWVDGLPELAFEQLVLSL